ncbi:MAG: MFS transporter [Desulfobacteraceae bacterium]|nr:MAG: MFS transporter [Desulfobacteraceae bacterium]
MSIFEKLGFSKPELKLMLLILIASMFDGVTQGILVMQETIAKKALLASDYQISLIGVIANATMVFSFFISYFFTNRSKRNLLFWGYLLGRFIFIFSFLITDSSVFLIFLFFFHGLFCIQVPVLNNFFQNYLAANRGFAFGIARMILMVFSMATSLIVGRLLDFSAGHYRFILPVIAASAAVTYFIFYKIESKIVYPTKALRKQLDFKNELSKIFKNGKFIMFESIFMVYGFAYMVCVPVVPLFLIKNLKLSYFEMAQAMGVYSQIFILLTIPFAGKIYDRINVWKIGSFSYAILIFYPLFFILSYFTQHKTFAFAGLLFYSLGLSGITILWNLGTIHFAQNADSFLYQGFHVSCTGLRGLAGPLLGYFVMIQFGLLAVFILSAVLFSAALLMNLIYSRTKGNQP